MSYATFADRNGSIDLTGVEVRHIGQLGEVALTDALNAPEAAPARRAIGWRPGASMGMFLSSPAAEIMIGDRGPWHLLQCAWAALIERYPCAISLVRLYCTDRGWVDGPDRAWLADYYQQCLRAGVARPQAGDAHDGPIDLGRGRILPPGDRVGWEEVIEWLRAGVEPVVTTLSVTSERCFPDRELAIEAGLWRRQDEADDEQGYAEDDAWDQLDYAERWELSMQALRTLEPERPRRWTPEAFARPRLTVAHLVELAADVRPAGRGGPTSATAHLL